ncbi:MAG TPA: hypothetical protein VFX45_01100 [Solirubrobacterales bacterium]|nr:hypothetical protein [Solirubrobacterales bacterium]
MRRAADQLPEGGTEGEEWEADIRAWIRTLMASMAANPDAGRLVLVDAYDGGPAMLREIEAATANLEQKLAEGPISMQIAQAILAGVERVLRTKILEGQSSELRRIEGELADWILRVGAMEPGQARASGAAPAGQQPLPPTQSRKDPAFAVFEAIGGNRGRILAAVARLSVDKGYWNLTATSLRREAGVSRREFDALFDDVGSCYAEAGKVLLTAAARVAIAKSDGSASWPDRVEQIVNDLCTAVARSPLLARLGFLDVFSPGGAGLLRRERLIKRSTGWVRASTPNGEPLTQLPTEASMAASWRLIQVELASGTGVGRLVEAPQLVTSLLLDSSARSTNREGQRNERT